VGLASSGFICLSKCYVDHFGKKHDGFIGFVEPSKIDVRGCTNGAHGPSGNRRRLGERSLAEKGPTCEASDELCLQASALKLFNLTEHSDDGNL
jgi:hypothetical protein